MSEITRTEPIRPTIANLMPPAMVDRLHRRALLAGVIAALLCILGAATHPHQFLRSYLVGYIMGLGLSLEGPGLLLFGTTLTRTVLARILSSALHCCSTMCGLLFIDGQRLITMCFMIMLTAALFNNRPMSQALVPETLDDLGNLTVGMVM